MDTRSGVERRHDVGLSALDNWLPGQPVERIGELWARFRPTPAELEPYEAGVTRLGPLLARPAILGFVGVLALVIGASQPTSPFTLTSVPGSWFFGIPQTPAVLGSSTTGGHSAMLSVLLFYAGMAIMLRAWYELLRITSKHPGIPLRKLVPVFVVWTLPLLVVAPLLSRDVYSYVAEGEMMSHGINPYSYGPAVLGVNSWVTMVDPLWQNVTSPYGPLFMAGAGAIVSLSGHNLLVSIIGMRLMALGGVILIAVFLPRLARSYGFDGSTALVLGVLNPIVLVNLVGGAHNDALMLGLLVAGLALARDRRPVAGAALVALAACVKVPAAIGLLYIGWEWLGDDASRRERLRPMVSTILVGAGMMLLVTEWVGLGWGWIGGLGNPDTLISWTTPTTLVAMMGGNIFHAVGLPADVRGLLTVSRLAGGLAAAAIGMRLFWRSRSRNSGRAIGLTLLIVTVLGPVIEPWYLAWGIVLLAAVAEPRMRAWLVALSCCFAFLGLPGGMTLVRGLTGNPALDLAVGLPLCVTAAFALSSRLRRLLGDGERSRTRRPLPEGTTV
jgi:hypothetical protein